MDYQVVIIGAGPGGYVAAIRAAQLGLKVALIEQKKVGGVCLNQGCIPTKTLVTSAELFKKIADAESYGISVTGAQIDWGKTLARKNKVVSQLVNGVEFLLKKNKVTLINGVASLDAPNSVRVKMNDGTEETITGEHIILATGSKPVTFPALGYNGINVVTSEEALHLEKLPSRAVIIGGGVIGCEFASIYASVGVEVTIVELLPCLLPLLEQELGKSLGSALEDAGVKILTNTRVQEVVQQPTGVEVMLANGEGLACDLVLLSLGRKPDPTGLGLEKLGVDRTEQGRIKVDRRLRTNLPWLYAIGDVNDAPYDLAHTASAQGIVAVKNIAAQDREIDYRAVPNCVFTIPQIASVGLSVEEAKQEGYQVKVGRFPMTASGKALSIGETAGFVLMVTAADSGRILGVHMMGPHVTELIAEATMAVEKEMTGADLAQVIHAHPTVAESVMEAAEATLGQSIHA